MSEREWRFYVDDMICFAERVIAYTRGFDVEAFSATDLNRDAALRNLELIGEAATHVPEEIRKVNPQLPWRMIIATRNRLIHGYLGIDDETLWNVIEVDVPVLLLELRQLKATLTVAAK